MKGFEGYDIRNDDYPFADYRDSLPELEEDVETGEVYMTDEFVLRGPYAHEIIRETTKSNVEKVYDMEQVYQLVDEQFKRSLKLSSKIGCGGPESENDVTPPTIEEVKRAFSTLTVEQLKIIGQMERPLLQIIPVAPISMYIKVISGLAVFLPQDYEYMGERFADSDKREGLCAGGGIIGWRVSFTEGADYISHLEGDNRFQLLGRLNWFRRVYVPRGVSGMDYKMGILLMMDGLQREKPVREFTFLNSEPLHWCQLPLIWYGRKWGSSEGKENESIRFGSRHILGPPPTGHKPLEHVIRPYFRLSVMKDAPGFKSHSTEVFDSTVFKKKGCPYG